MVDYIAVNQKTMDYMKLLEKRVQVLEEQARIWSKSKSKASGPSRVVDPSSRVNLLVKKSLEMERDRMAILEFNRENSQLDPENMLKWNHTKILKGGRERTLTFTKVDDILSLTSLIQSDHKELLCNSGPEFADITCNIFKKYWVVILEGKLVPLCRDFKGGIGSEYLWSTDEEMSGMPPSEDWKNESKMKNDPRRKFIDPETMQLWVPDCERLDVVSEPANDFNEDDGSTGENEVDGGDEEQVEEEQVEEEQVEEEQVDEEEVEYKEVDEEEVEEEQVEEEQVEEEQVEEEQVEDEEVESEEEEESLRMEKKMRYG